MSENTANIPVQLTEMINIHIDDILLEEHGIVNCRGDLGDLTELIENIKRVGLLSNPMVWEVPTPTEEDADACDYVLLCGHRRIAALKEINAADPEDPVFTQLDCLIFSGELKDAQSILVGDNFHNKTLTESDLIDAVGNLHGLHETQVALAEALSTSQAKISRHLRLYFGACDKVKAAIRAGSITMKQAKGIVDEHSEKKEGSKYALPKVAEQEAALAALLEKPEPSQREKKPKTFRTRKDVDALVKELRSEEVEADPTHERSLLQFVMWMRCEIELDDLLSGAADVSGFSAVEEPDAQEDAPKKKRRTRNTESSEAVEESAPEEAVEPEAVTEVPAEETAPVEEPVAEAEAEVEAPKPVKKKAASKKASGSDKPKRRKRVLPTD